MSFNGFISYSHAADGRLAPAVQRGLHRLARPWHRRRALWIFRDQTGLAVTPGLWSSIQAALDESEYFVLLASPEAARSPWVNREIEHWIATKSADRILPVVTDGEWAWDAGRGDFSEGSTAVPPALQGVFTEEPFFLDLRWARGEQLSLQHSRFRDAIAQLAAPMHGVSTDELEGEDVRQHRRARRLGTGAVATLSVLALLAALTGMSAVRNSERADASLAEALRQQKVADGQRDLAVQAADEARRQEESARQQQDRAALAAAEAEKSERLAREQQIRADQAAADALRQQRLADQATTRTVEQQKLARQAAERAEREQKEADRLARIAEEQRRLADQAASEADRQQRIAVSRRLMTQATAEIGRDPKTALMLGAAAEELNPDAVTRRELTGVVTATFYAGSISDVKSAKYLPDGALVTLGTDGRVSLWNVSDPGRPARIAKIGATGDLVMISPDGRTLALVDANRKAVLWDIANRSRPARLATAPTAGPVTAMAFSGDGSIFVTGEATGDTTLWNTSDRTRPTPLAMLRGSGSDPRAVARLAIRPDGGLLIVSTSSARTAYDLTDPADPVEIEVDIGGDVNGAIIFSSDGSRLAVGDGGRVTLENMTEVIPAPQTQDKASRDRVEPPPPLPEPEPEEDWEPLEQLSGTLTGYINAMAFSSDNNLVAAADRSGVAEVWDRRIERESRYYTLVRASTPIIELSFNTDATVLVSTDTSGTATLWNVAPAGAPDPIAKLVAGKEYTRDTVFSRDGRSLISAGSDGTAFTWDTKDPRHPVRGADLVLADGDVGDVTFSPDRRTVAIINSRPWGTTKPINLTLADVAAPARATTLITLPDGNWGSPVFSPDGRTLAVGFDETTVQLWNVADRTHPARLGELTLNPGQYGVSMAFSPDGRTLATGRDDQRITLWDVADRSAPVRLGAMVGHSDTVGLLTFSPDGRSLASADGRSAMLWDVTDKRRPQRLATLSGFGDRVGAIAFSADSRSLAIGDMIAKVIVWDTTDPARPIRVASMNGTFRHETKNKNYSQIRGFAFRSDGHTLAVTGQAPTRFEQPDIALWDFRKLNSVRADPAGKACSLTGRGLTAAEWARYIPEIRYQRTCAK